MPIEVEAMKLRREVWYKRKKMQSTKNILKIKEVQLLMIWDKCVSQKVKNKTNWAK